MPIIRKSLLQLVFSGSYMKRWNDKLRPLELVEVDKQAHKMMVAWVLYVINSRDMDQAERLALGEAVVAGGVFDYFYRLVITDIKPPVFYRIKANPEHYRLLTKWVLEQLGPRILPMGKRFFKAMSNYMHTPTHDDLAGRILSAAHLFASSTEFALLKGVNEMDQELSEIEADFVSALAGFEDIPGVAQMNDPSSVLGRFLRLCGRLRFQKRWSQTPRIPETTVLGHMFIVACYAWLFSLEGGACQARQQNGFFAGLFHDLPELLTRDIISPVKRSAASIGEFIKQYEEMELEDKVLGPLRKGGYPDVAERLSYFLGLTTGSEFTCQINQGGVVSEVSHDELNATCNLDELDPKDGELVKACDNLAAFIEAYTALRNGIASDQLHEAQWRIRKMYHEKPVAGGVQMGALLADFD